MAFNAEPDPVVVEAVIALINGWSWAEKRQLLESRRAVFALPDTDRVFGALARQYEADPAQLERVELHRTIVRDALEHGVDHALAPYAAAPTVDALDQDLATRMAAMTTEAEFLTMFSREPHLRRRLLDILNAFLNAPTVLDKRAAVEQHAGILLTPGMDLMLSSEALDQPAIPVHRDLLRAVRTQGMDAAFAALGPDEPESYVMSSMSVLDSLQSPTDAAERIDTARRALSVLPRTELPPAVGIVLRLALAGGLVDLQSGDRAGNIEEALRILHEALDEAQALPTPTAPAPIHEALGQAYYARLSPDRARDVALAQEHYERALALHDPRREPVAWARLAVNAAQISGTERALELLQQAVRVYTRDEYPREWAGAQMGLGQAFVRRAGRSAEDVDRGIEHLQAALTVFGRRSDTWAWLQATQALGRALSGRLGDDREADLHAAQAQFTAALEVADPAGVSDVWASLHADLADVELELGGTDAVERAIAHLEAALRIHTADGFPDQWASEMFTLARAYRRRAAGSVVVNLQQAGEFVAAAQSFFTLEAWPDRWVDAEIERGMIATALADYAGSEYADEAVRHFDAALAVITRESHPDAWGRANANLAAAHLKREGPDAAEDAARCLAAAQEVFTLESDPERWLLMQQELASTELAHHRDDPTRVEDVVARCREALRVTRAPDDAWIALTRTLADALLILRRWEPALAQYDALQRTGDQLREAIASDAGRFALAGRLSGVPSRAAYCLLALRRGADAVVRLERGRTRSVREHRAVGRTALARWPRAASARILEARERLTALEAEERRVPIDTESRPEALLGSLLQRARAELNASLDAVGASLRDGELTLAEILRLPPAGGALAIPVVTPVGSAIVVVTEGLDDVTDEQVLWLEEVTTESVGALRDRGIGVADALPEDGFLAGRVAWQQGPTPERLARWEAIADAVTRRLWIDVAEPLLERLRALGVAPEAEVCVVGGEALAELPLHAAWREHDGGRRWLIDEYLITYAPSALTLAVMHESLVARAPAPTGLLAIADPREDDERAADEARRVAALFAPDATTVLAGSAATQPAIVAAARGRTHVHFAGPSHFNYQQPLYSGLWIGGGDYFLIGDLVAHLRLDAARLVTLSGMESAVVDILLAPDEPTGLPIAFALAGAPGIVAASWEVERAASRIVERLHRLHLDDGMAPARALRTAQRWARDQGESVLGWAGLRFIGV